MTTKRLTTNALLLTIALVTYIIEAQIPVPVPVPGVKLGLSNIIIVYCIFRVGAKDAFVIMLLRIIMGSIFGGQMMSFFFSLGGGLVSFPVMALISRIVTKKQIFVVSVFGAIAHNIGQILAAIFVFRSVAVAAYLPFLIVSGVITGLLTGFAAQYVVGRIRNAQQ